MQAANVPNSALQCRYRYPRAPPTRLSLRHHEYNYYNEDEQANLTNRPKNP